MKVHDAAFWDERHAAKNAPAYSGPNPQLAAEVAHLTPGEALDAGCGDGDDAIWLAQNGWSVTAADISQVALDRAASVAAALGLSAITWRQADLVQTPPSAQSYDLVSSHFMQLPTPLRETAMRGLAAAVKRGGTLLIVAHDPSDLDKNAGRWPIPEYYATAEEFAALFDRHQWEMERVESRPRIGTNVNGDPVTVHDVIVRVRRR
jgi:ubiquinone/menaquinone biosynthesis C-methylase UbiE